MSLAIRQSGVSGNVYATGKLHKSVPWLLLVGSWVALILVFALLNAGGAVKDFNVVAAVFLGTVLFDVLIVVVSRIVEGGRKAVDRLVTSLVVTAFVIAVLPLVSLLWTVLGDGLARFDAQFFSYSMRGVISEGGGAIHALVGTLEITLFAALISVPIGLLTSIYLVEYGKGVLAKGITFFVDVMTGIPSIVAGLFAYSLFALFLGPGARFGLVGSVALSVLMIPIVVRSTEEVLKIVPMELREASYALGVPKYLTILKVVLPTSLAGITTGVMLSIARVIGETAPLLVTAGFTASLNYDLFKDPMMTLPVFAYTQYSQQGANPVPFVDRAWTAALVLILIVMLLNLLARFITRLFAPSSRADPRIHPPRRNTVSKRIEVDGLNVYYSKFKAVEGVDMTIEPRTVTAFIGPSGCGKSTFLRTLNRMHEVIPGAYVEGSVKIDGDDLYGAGVDPVLVRRQVGMVFQRPNPFPTMSIKDNVLAGVKLNNKRLSRSEADEIVERSLQGANLWNEVKDRLDKPGMGLSGGQQQRLCIARAIAVQPDVLLMDEPCSALDPISTLAIEDLIEELKKEYTIVIVTHNMQQASRVSDKTAFFNIAGTGAPGKLIEFDDTATMFSNPSVQATEDYVSGRFG